MRITWVSACVFVAGCTADTVDSADHLPYPRNDVFLFNPDGNREGDILANDSDIEGHELRVSELPPEFTMVSDTVAAIGELDWVGNYCRPYTISDGYSSPVGACIYVVSLPPKVTATLMENHDLYLPDYINAFALMRFSSAQPAHGTVDGRTYSPTRSFCGTDSFSIVFDAENGRAEVPMTVDVQRESPMRTSDLTYGETSTLDMTLDGQPREVQTVKVYINTYYGAWDGWDWAPYRGVDFVTVSADGHTLSISPPSTKASYEVEYTARDATGCTSLGTIRIHVDGP